MARVKIIHEVPSSRTPNHWTLSFQWCEYYYDDGRVENGYRFIWYRPDGTLQAARGQARIPDATNMFELIRQATEAGWFINCESAV